MIKNHGSQMVSEMHGKKKNNMYKAFLTCRSIATETRYKIYINKLTNVLKRAKKKYYSDQLFKQKNSIAATWKTLKSIMGTARDLPQYPNHFTENGVSITNKEYIIIANMFDDFL